MSETKPLIVVTRRIPEAGLRLLNREHYQLKVSPHDRVLTARELESFVRGASAILAQLTDKINRSILTAAGKELKVIANYAVGFDNIDLAAARRQKVIITNTPGVLTEAVAEQTFALLLGVARRLVEAHEFTRAGRYKAWAPELLLGEQLQGKTFGILGLGRIGSRVAAIAARGYQMRVIYFDSGKSDRRLEQELGAKAVTIRKLLTTSDVISLHVPLTPKTRHLIGKTELLSMKRTAILINTARGPVVDEKALAWALKNQIIWGAGLDVFEFEPKITPELLKLKNVVLTPHTASATYEARNAMAELAAKNILAVLADRLPLTPVR